MAFPDLTLGHRAFALGVKIASHLEDIAENVRNIGDSSDNYGRRQFTGVIAADGSFRYEFNAQAGAPIELLTFGLQVGPPGGAPNGYVAFYTDDTVGAQLLKVFTLSSMVTDEFTDGTFIPSGSRVIVVIGSATAGLVVGGSVQYREVNPSNVKKALNAGQEFPDRYLPAGDITLLEDEHAPLFAAGEHA